MPTLQAQTIYISWIVALVLLFIIWSRISSASDVESVTVSLTSADILALATTKKVLVKAVPGKRIMLVSADLSVTAGDEAYTGGGALAVYQGSSLLTTTWAATVVTDATATPLKNAVYSATVSAPVNTALTLGAAAAFEDGNGTAKVTVRYYLI